MTGQNQDYMGRIENSNDRPNMLNLLKTCIYKWRAPKPSLSLSGMMMMKMPQSCIPISRKTHCGIYRVFRVLFYSTGTVPSSSSKDTLYSRLVQFGKLTTGFSIQGVLDQWVGEGRALEREELRVTIKQLRKFKRYKQALEVYPFLCRSLSLYVHVDLLKTVLSCEASARF